MFNQNISDCIAFLNENKDVITNGVELFVPSSTGKGYELSDTEIWDLDEGTPCEWIVADEETYNKLANYPSFIPFSDKDGKALMVVVPQEVAENLPYYTVVASIMPPSSNDFLPLGSFECIADGEPVFCNDESAQKCYTEDEAKKLLEEIKEYCQSSLKIGETISLATCLHYHEGSEWVEDDCDNYEELTYQHKDISGALVVDWSWQTHVGYARKFISIRYVSEYDAVHNDSLLIEKYQVFVPQSSLLLSVAEIQEAKNMGVLTEQIEEELFRNSWKWQNLSAVRTALEELENK